MANLAGSSGEGFGIDAADLLGRLGQVLEGKPVDVRIVRLK
jgi:hypothetical protein